MNPRTITAAHQLRMGPVLESSHFQEIRTQLALGHCKWDPQIGDRSSLCPQPLLMDSGSWEQLARWSEALAAEIVAAEMELAQRPEYHRELGMPRSLRLVLQRGSRQRFTSCAVRVMRFDFHPTTDGWRVSEVNSDVPGGFAESSPFARLMAKQYRDTRIAGDPLAAWLGAMVATVGSNGTVALLSAPGYMEDQQVTALLAATLGAQGIEVRLIHRPEQLTWRSGHATPTADSAPISAIVRFYQAEWICRSRPRVVWQPLFVGGNTPVSNPALAAMSESKRFPLLWDALRTPVPTCRALFPLSSEPRAVAWQSDEGWVVKGAYSNNGDQVRTRAAASATQWRALAREVKRHPRRWVLQRRFEPLAIDSTFGALFPCIGVYVIDGVTAGAYARLATERVVDHRAMDAALLIVDRAAS